MDGCDFVDQRLLGIRKTPAHDSALAHGPHLVHVAETVGPLVQHRFPRIRTSFLFLFLSLLPFLDRFLSNFAAVAVPAHRHPLLLAYVLVAGLLQPSGELPIKLLQPRPLLPPPLAIRRCIITRC